MPGLPLNKSSLKQERSRLATYKRFLPSLDLKRRQLMLELRRAEQELAGVGAEADGLASGSREILALLGSVDMRLEGLVRVRDVELVDDSVVGVTLPRLESVDIVVAPYSTLAKPFWFDGLVATLRSTLELRARRAVAVKRVQLLHEAVRKVTQRVNLFDKVLIPEAEANIKRIQIHLSDAERAAVVRSKITKAKRQNSGAVA